MLDVTRKRYRLRIIVPAYPAIVFFLHDIIETGKSAYVAFLAL